MRVVQVLATSGGGVGRHVLDLATGLAREGSPVVVAGPASTDAAFGFSAAGLAFRAVEISDRPRPAADALAVLRLRRLAGGAQVIHAHGLRAGALTVLAARGVRPRPAVVVTLHNALVGGGRIAAVHAVLERIVARGADAVLVVSGDLATAISRRGARDVERGLVPAPDRGPAATPPQRLRAGLGVPDGTALLVTVARLAPQKGLEVLADALAALGAARPDLPVRAVVAGDGPLAAALAADASRRGLPLDLVGRRDDVADLLAAADVVVVPSIWEGQPLIVQEALRAGAAIVATDAGGTREVTQEAAALVRSGDPGQLADALARLLDEPSEAAALRDRARSRAAQLPTAADAVRQVTAVYRRVATRPADRRDPPGSSATG